VLPDSPAIDREFTYSVPEKWRGLVDVGSRVRIPLHGRRVGGWVTALGVEAPEGVDVQAVTGWSGVGPPAEVLELAEWAAWRWAGRRAHFLASADPPKVVRARPTSRPTAAPPAFPGERERAAFGAQRAVVRVPPAADVVPWAKAAAAAGLGRGGVLVIVPGAARAAWLARQLSAAGLAVAAYPDDWARAAAGEVVVVGTRLAAWAPLSRVGAALIVDSHDEGLKEERAPTWEAHLVVAERCRRDSAPCVRLSPCPTVDDLEWGALTTLPRGEEHAGWSTVEVVDLRETDPREGLLTARVANAARSTDRLVMVVNRRGRAALLACQSCQSLATCERCGGATRQIDPDRLECGRCGLGRPFVCLDCGSTRFRSRLPGTSRLAEHLTALIGEEVPELSGPAAPTYEHQSRARIVVGTEAALHRAGRRQVAVFLDFDQELLAPRLRAAEQAIALLARAARLVRGRAGRLIIQTRIPDHPVIRAGVAADPGLLADVEREQRRALALPPFSAVAELSGPAAEEYAGRIGPPATVAALTDRWLVRADSTDELCDALASANRPSGRLRVELDPRRI
jgi:primosomal protein N' (replication factor Y) (superfamily II helicase)